MKRVIFLSKSKLAANLLQFLLHDSKINFLSLQDPKDLNPKLFSQKKNIIIIDDTFLAKTTPEEIASITQAKLANSQKIIFLTDAKAPKTSPCPVTEVLTKPFLADELITRIEKYLGGKA